jgi:hypothetical protein
LQGNRPPKAKNRQIRLLERRIGEVEGEFRELKGFVRGRFIRKVRDVA